MQELNKGKKIALIWAASVLGGFLLFGCIVNIVARHQLRAALANIPGAEVRIDKIHLSLLAGNLELKDVAFAVKDTSGAGPNIQASVAAVKLKHIHWFRLLKGEAQADKLLIQKPEARVTLKKQKPQGPTDTTQAQEPFLKKVFLEQLQIKDGKIAMKSQADSTKVSAQALNFFLGEVALDLPEGHFAFNDSTYRVALDSLDYTDAPGLSRSQIAHLETRAAGPVEALAIHLYNCVPQEQLAEKMGKVAVMWYDVQLDSLATSAINIPRLIGNRSVDIDNIRLVGKKATVLQDDRYKPAVPYATIQESVNSMKPPLKIKQIDAHLNDFTFIWETTHVNRGAFPLNNVDISINSVSNAPGNVMALNLKSGQSSRSSLNFSVSIKNDKPETTWGKMKITNLEAAKLDAFTRPLFGATVEASFHQIDCEFKGDKNQMGAHFCMLYDHLTVKAWDDANAPIQFVARNSGFATFLANLLLPNANPPSPMQEPKEVGYSFKRDPMQPYPAYLIQSLTNGMLHTLLPGGKIRRRNS